jgi:hypothetical protein
MEGQAIVEVAVDQLEEVLRRPWSAVLEQLDAELSMTRVHAHNAVSH